MGLGLVRILELGVWFGVRSLFSGFEVWFVLGSGLGFGVGLEIWRLLIVIGLGYEVGI